MNEISFMPRIFRLEAVLIDLDATRLYIDVDANGARWSWAIVEPRSESNHAEMLIGFNANTI